MYESKFINEKSEQLIDTFNRFLMNSSDYRSVIDLTWNILFEWQQIAITGNEAINTKERVFWHMIFELQYWDEEILRNNKNLRKELYNCILYLQREKKIPVNCIGLRPDIMGNEDNIENTQAMACA